jgi:hypothetical protein
MSENVQYVAGISLLALALFMSSCLGIIQEATYKQYGKKWREGLFYTVSPEIRSIWSSADNLAFPEFTCFPTFLPIVAIKFRGIFAFDASCALRHPDSYRDPRFSIPLPPARWYGRKRRLDTMEEVDDPFRTGSVATERHHARRLRKGSQSPHYCTLPAMHVSL